MSAEHLRIGLIGFGNVVQAIHLEALSRLEGVEVVAVAESDPARHEKAAQRSPGAAVVSSYDELLEMPGIEGVIVCLPSTVQAAAAVAAFKAGKHVYVEKPLAARLDDARAIADAWREAGTVGMVGLNYRVHPHYVRAREVIRSGRLGGLVAARSVFSTSSTFPQPEWKRSRATGGGVLLDFGSHHADLVHFLFSQPVREAFAEVLSQHGEHDSATVSLRLGDGMLVQMFLSLSAVDEERFEVYGQEGKMTVDRCYALDVTVRGATRERDRLRRAWGALRSLRHAGFLVTRSRAVGCEPSYSIALGRFANAARAGRPARPDISDGVRSLAVVEAAHESIDRGAPVSVADTLEPDPERV